MNIIHPAFCGSRELSGLSQYDTPEEAFNYLKVRLQFMGGWRREIPFIIFSGTVGEPLNMGHCNGRQDDYVAKFAQYLEDNGFGKVMVTEEKINWTRNTVKMAIWTPDYSKIWALLDKEYEDLKKG